MLLLSDFVPDVNMFIYLNIILFFFFGQYGICAYFWYKKGCLKTIQISRTVN